ncbi:hypothetical protein J1605_019014 [Eschrichtius robustus]|uniref:Uncharacterized protein n=1 Tax=Eschrichtius robustus TaxID=9764 RepID=A0AB34HRZ9_ESCRO|nr:hypothetical protein J1605_019014 [Eschrichtius robustus]
MPFPGSPSAVGGAVDRAPWPVCTCWWPAPSWKWSGTPHAFRLRLQRDPQAHGLADHEAELGGRADTGRGALLTADNLPALGELPHHVQEVLGLGRPQSATGSRSRLPTAAVPYPCATSSAAPQGHGPAGGPNGSPEILPEAGEEGANS